MRPEAAASAFEELLRQHSLDVARLSVAQGLSAMLAFYRDERAEGCRADCEEDMLLYQWGTYNGDHGEFFELNITRQLLLDGSSEDDDIWQLGLTFRFLPTESLLALRSGDRWCHGLNELEEFRRSISASEALKAVATLVPAAIELQYECAGVTFRVGPVSTTRLQPPASPNRASKSADWPASWRLTP